MHACFNCKRPETETPLLSLTFNQEPYYICAQCLPILIHKQHQLAGKLPGFTPPSENR
jgi:hypothetical protein